MINHLKKLFSRKKSSDAIAMWDKLGDLYTGDPEFHPSLDLDAKLALSLNEKERNEYLQDLVRRRNIAHDKYS